MNRIRLLLLLSVAAAQAPAVGAQAPPSADIVPLPSFSADRILIDLLDESRLQDSYSAIGSIGREYSDFFVELPAGSQWGPTFAIREPLGGGGPSLSASQLTELEAARDNARDDQLRVYRAALSSAVLYGAGAEAIDVILSGLAANISMSMSASPFVAPTFERQFGTLSKVLDQGPAAGALVGAFAVSEGNQRDAMLVLAGGFVLKLIGDVLSGASEAQLSQELSTVTQQLHDTHQLLTYNRMAHADLAQLQKHAEGLLAADSTLARAFRDLQDEIQVPTGTDPDDQLTDGDILDAWSNERYKARIEHAVALSVRFRERVQAVRYVLEQTEGMIAGFQDHLSAGRLDVSEGLGKEAADALAQAEALFNRHRSQWESLAGRYYSVDAEIAQWSLRFQAGADAYRVAELALARVN